MKNESQAVKHSIIHEIISWALHICIPIAIAIIIFKIITPIIIVQGSSMYPTLKDGNIVITQAIFYTPHNGDIVVAKSTGYAMPIIKRCIATAGQTVDIDYAENTVYVDGEVLDEPYLNFDEKDVMVSPEDTDAATASYFVPEGYIFLMGDNRNYSTDSRSERIGLIPVESVIGKKLIVIPIHTKS